MVIFNIDEKQKCNSDIDIIEMAELDGKIKAINQIITYINHLEEKKNESS